MGLGLLEIMLGLNSFPIVPSIEMKKEARIAVNYVGEARYWVGSKRCQKNLRVFPSLKDLSKRLVLSIQSRYIL